MLHVSSRTTFPKTINNFVVVSALNGGCRRRSKAHLKHAMDLKNNNIKTISKVPFYEPPPRKTSAEIINEARLAIRESQMADNSFVSTSIKPVQTKRPFTPREKERILFGKNGQAKRPPSSFSLRYLQNETDLPATPPDDNSMILTPNMVSNLNFPNETKKTRQEFNVPSQLKEGKIFNIGVKEHKIKLPALESTKLLPKRKLQKSTCSLDNLPEENESVYPKSSDTRKAFSSPQENTTFDEITPPIKQKNLSECLLLGPQNLDKIFENRHIIAGSETLFSQGSYFNRDVRKSRPKITKSFSVLEMCDNMKERTFDDVLDLLNSEQYRNNDGVTINLLNELYDCMEKEKMIAVHVGSKTKIHILKCLYKYVESQNEQLLLNIGRIILALKVTGNNLSGVCKLIFKVAKNDKNDNLFLQKNVLELFLDALGRSSPLDDAEACVYGYGSVKFLTMNPKLLQKIQSLGILQLMVLHLKIVNNAKMEKAHMPQHTNHAVFQLTGALRNLISEESNYEVFIASGAIQQLCQGLEFFAADLDIVSNISRILSTISMNDCCCDAIADYKNIFKIFVQLFDKYPGNEEIIVRLAYTVGTIVAKLDNTREKLYHEKNSTENMLNLWKIYLEKTLKQYSLKSENGEDGGSGSEDVMIKIIRVIANMVINPEVGKALNQNYGIQLVNEFLKVLISNPFKKNDELVLSILSTINNLSYYYTSDLNQDLFSIKQIGILEAVAEYCQSDNKEIVVETMRILGNLSRSNTSRNYIVESDIFNVLFKVLNTDDMMVLRTTVGVFVNLLVDHKSRLMFKNKKGVSQMIHILNEHGHDWILAMLVCQALWNLCIDTSNLHELIAEDEVQELLGILADSLDEDRIFGLTSNTENCEVFATQEFLLWEEYASVATNLLEKIENFLDTQESNSSS